METDDRPYCLTLLGTVGPPWRVPGGSEVVSFAKGGSVSLSITHFSYYNFSPLRFRSAVGRSQGGEVGPEGRPPTPVPTYICYDTNIIECLTMLTCTLS